jgi:hypothetical protein
LQVSCAQPLAAFKNQLLAQLHAAFDKGLGRSWCCIGYPSCPLHPAVYQCGYLRHN